MHLTVFAGEYEVSCSPPPLSLRCSMSCTVLLHNTPIPASHQYHVREYPIFTTSASRTKDSRRQSACWNRIGFILVGESFLRFKEIGFDLYQTSVNGLMVRILPFQGRGPGSIPGGRIFVSLDLSGLMRRRSLLGNWGKRRRYLWSHILYRRPCCA